MVDTRKVLLLTPSIDDSPWSMKEALPEVLIPIETPGPGMVVTVTPIGCTDGATVPAVTASEEGHKQSA